MNKTLNGILRSSWFFFFVSCLFWIVAFRRFLIGEIGFSSDAVSYYDHTKFYIDNLLHGVFPLWDPFWSCGASNDFFLQRIGPYNPFLLIIVILRFLGMPHGSAYMIFLVTYYFAGCVGFYLLAKNILQHDLAAKTAFLLMLFSALGTRLFDSYLVLVATPLFWFFYFLTAFFKNPRKEYLFGLTLSAMLLLTTYIPFFFIIIFGSFIVFYLVFYFRDLGELCFKTSAFLRKNKVVLLVCLGLILLSLAPGAEFFLHASRENIAIAGRGGAIDSTTAVGVRNQVATGWGIFEDLLFSSYFWNMTKFKLAVFYVPLFSLVIFFIGFLSRTTKLAIFLGVWATFTFIMGAPFLSPLYDFLRAHVSIFKYFRNLHFFLWWVLLPVGILFICEQLKNFISGLRNDDGHKKLFWGWVILVHAGFVIYFLARGEALASSYLSLIFSFLFFFLLFRRSERSALSILAALLWAAIVMQPLQAYQYLVKNSYLAADSAKAGSQLYDLTQERFSYERSGTEVASKGSFYYGSKYIKMFVSSLSDEKLLTNYTFHKIYLYSEMPSAEYANKVELAAWIKLRGRPVTGPGNNFQVLSFNANSLEVLTHFDKDTALVYTDSFDTRWQVYVDGKRWKLDRVNIGFKGLLVPQGEHRVRFYFNGPYALHGILLASCFVLLVLILMGMFKRIKQENGTDA
ncbi:MAG: YfhO family protein [Candidatus Omnitrophica bacterium]|nr:YfhO family protein [Candidatus Omnitrophota bacterium]